MSAIWTLEHNVLGFRWFTIFLAVQAEYWIDVLSLAGPMFIG
ncbi:MAG: hypothetical protein SFV23_02395 [Planctomycetaceae bacterium]|nr:hypothetical protein [Planctomycetaceae bacterium]